MREYDIFPTYLFNTACDVIYEFCKDGFLVYTVINVRFRSTDAPVWIGKKLRSQSTKIYVIIVYLPSIYIREAITILKIKN